MTRTLLLILILVLSSWIFLIKSLRLYSSSVFLAFLSVTSEISIPSSDFFKLSILDVSFVTSSCIWFLSCSLMSYNCWIEFSVYVSSFLLFSAADISLNISDSFISFAFNLFSLILAFIPAISIFREAMSSSINLSFSSYSDIKLSSISFFLVALLFSLLSLSLISFLKVVISNLRDSILLSRLLINKSLSSSISESLNNSTALLINCSLINSTNVLLLLKNELASLALSLAFDALSLA